ncbi:hypothetical protein H696_05198 [Fonticula alba]|uniref:Nucleolar protein 56 n=1 Tax=Fonticula alba TaxID=691883 RepID=A0A058Z416_FONAL|nr:hypothetical protein H696_05198 [Fonticula alba]KCV68277.1 hypothetical protein H696_05198 [Fonticula alba]|eukprot:XP_009497331.1 hypothetical protein H696_05198 [Fonticula alba]
MSLFLLFESASGYALFERTASEEIGQELESVQTAMQDLSKAGKVLKLKSFAPFQSAAHALENINDITEGIVNDYLKNFLTANLAKSKKVKLGVQEARLGGAISDATGISCDVSDVTTELLRGIRMHFEKLIKQFREGDLEKAQLGLGHAYSRAKLKFNINRSDNMIIQAISLLDQLDKDLNTFSMRVREWYSWHFPELTKLVADNSMFAKLVSLIKDKATLTQDSHAAIEEIVMDEAKAQSIIDAAKSSMGTDISQIDMINIEAFANRVISLSAYRRGLYDYLQSKMNVVAPNLCALIGEMVGARLISHAGSLTNLSKYPASTVQILGAEKALFRALKTRGNTPKYGLIFHSSFIGRAGSKNKGRISRYLANKTSLAARIDCFSDAATTKFGEALRNQVEDRLKFYETGQAPAKNIDVMQGVIHQLAKDAPASSSSSSEEETPKSEKKDKKEKKEKKEKKDKKEEKSEKKDKKRRAEDDADESDKKKSKKSKKNKD